MDDLLKDLNQAQKEAVSHEDGPLLIVAGAGTGKTTVITRRLAFLILEKKIKPDEILALTFTEKAAGEMEERADQLLPYGYVDLWISTFHSFCERILKEHAIDIGLPGDFKLLNQTEQWLLMRQNLERFNLDYYRPLGNPTKFIHSLLKHFSRAKDEEIWPENYLDYAENLKLNKDSAIAEDKDRLLEVASAYHTYEQLLLENNALDFGDLINYTLKLFRTRPAILEKYRQKFKYILVDEFQDTNWAQYELIKMLAAPKNNLTVVGDDDQSIYKFRGASISNIMQFKNDFPYAREIIITDNYRTKQNILDLAYKFIKQNNPNRLEAKLGIVKKLAAQREGEGIIDHLHCKTADQEARAVAEKILELKKSDTATSWQDFAILVRANNQAEMFMGVLDQCGIPYHFLASSGLYGKPVILDIIAYLKTLDNYHESTALYRVLNMPFVDLVYDDLLAMNFSVKKKNWSLYEAMKHAAAVGVSGDGLRKINKILGFIERHTAIARERGVSKVVFKFLEDFQYLANLTKRAEKGDLRAAEDIGYINNFLKKIEEFERANPDKSIKNFMTELDMALESGEEGSLAGSFDEGPDTVKILTVHGAKGLEFKYVFIVNLVDLRFPSTDRKEPIEMPAALVKEILPEGDIHLEEERRLFYVAMTRARDGLFLTSAADYGGQRKKKLSRFLVELGFVTPEAVTPTGQVYFDEEKQTAEGRTPVKKFWLPSKFSFTQLKAFETCPLQYKFAHVLVVPTRGKFTFSFGKSMHGTLQKFFDQISKKENNKQADLFGGNRAGENTAVPSVEDLLKIYEETWINDWYDSKSHEDEYKKLGRVILREFYKLHEGQWPKTKFLEKGFNLKIGDSTVRGVIDRIDDVLGGVEIVDYKTGSVPKDEKYLDKDQLLIYQAAASEVFGEKPVTLSYYYLGENKKMSFLGTDEELGGIKEKIAATIEEIKKSEFLPKPSLFTCKNCDFKDICEHRVL
ncbi:MAG: UvrD-helicase domain-containing protein [Patescibacteria group bacterium]|jgi:DNA helicase-2/ATP-dependent DNA helicase PcrA